MERDALHALIIGVAAEVTDIDLTGVSLDDDLFSLGLDSLDFATVLVEVEERLPEEIPAEAFDRFADLDDFSMAAILDALIGDAS